MYSRLVNRVVFPMHERLKGKPTHRILTELDASQWLAPERVRELQFRRLKRHLEFAYREVPYYQRLLDEHQLQPNRIQSPEDYARIPCLTKDIIRSRFAELQPRRQGRGVKRVSSGGSTGSPVTVLVDPVRAAFTDAARLRTHRWFGVDMGARELVLWGSPIELGRQDHLRSLRDRLLNSRLVSAFDLGAEGLDRCSELLRRYRPEKLYGYASALALLASGLLRRGRLGPSPGVRAVFATAEPLYDFQRRLIEQAFGCPVSVEYGCRDGGLVAMQCPSGSLHIAAEGMMVEVMPEEGGRGELVLSNLESWAMPIIRYRTGDVGALHRDICACGRGLPVLGSVEGRRTDFLVTPSGKVMHALAAIYVLREEPTVRQFQIIQEEVDHVSVRIVPDGELTTAARQRVLSGLSGLFDGEATIDIELTSEIAHASGKHRYVISHVAERRLNDLLGAVSR